MASLCLYINYLHFPTVKLGKNGGLIDDFLIIKDKYQFNVLNAPSPAATASLANGEKIANSILQRL
ncbi:hypothetical protein ES705_25955 [subsurface metagenome]